MSPLAMPPLASLLALLVLRPAPSSASEGSSRYWKALVSVGDVMSLQGWDGTEITVRGGEPPSAFTGAFDGTSGFANGAYLAGYAGLDPHFQLGGFLSYVGFGQAASRTGDDEAFYRTLSVVGLGLSAKGGARIHRVVWIGAALDVGLAILLPRNVALLRAGPGLELDPWYGMFLFPRLHVDIVATGERDVGVGFFWDLGPMLVPIAAGSGSGPSAGAELEFSTWSACIQMVLGFSLGSGGGDDRTTPEPIR